MNKERINVSRREFLIRSTAIGVGAGAGFSLGLYLPIISREVLAARGSVRR